MAGTYLIVGHEAFFLRVAPGLAAAHHLGADVKHAGVLEGEGTAVHGHPHHDLLSRGALLLPLPHTVVLCRGGKACGGWLGH